MMTKEQQAIYYQEAERQRQLHKQLYPEWSNGDNYVSPVFQEESRRQSTLPAHLLTLLAVLLGQKAVSGREKKSLHKVQRYTR